MAEQNKEILPNVTNIKSSETYVLPSKGLLYKPEDNIPASITLRRMTTKEDKMRMRNESEDTIRRDILQACITTPGIDAGKLKLMDANFLLFRLRAISLLNDIYKIQCMCPKCGAEFIHEVNLSEVPIVYFDEKKLDKLEVILPVNGNKITLKYPSLNDMITRGKDLRNYFDKFPNIDKNEAVYTMSGLLYVDKVNENTLLSEELEAYLDNLDILDNRAFRRSISDIDNLYGFEEELSTVCPSCNAEVKHGLPITSELFNPSL